MNKPLTAEAVLAVFRATLEGLEKWQAAPTPFQTQKPADEAPSAVWRPIETAPRDGSQVLLLGYPWGSPLVQLGTWHQWWRPWGSECLPTHWMPLPPIPTTIPIIPMPTTYRITRIHRGARVRVFDITPREEGAELLRQREGREFAAREGDLYRRHCLLECARKADREIEAIRNNPELELTPTTKTTTNPGA